MLTLAIYSNLNKIDLTHGKTIVGTGTIDADGNVGQISGIKYKLLGAVANKGDIFLVPDGDNYKEALLVGEAGKQKIMNNYSHYQAGNIIFNFIKSL